jgi:hypothetical protein
LKGIVIQKEAQQICQVFIGTFNLAVTAQMSFETTENKYRSLGENSFYANTKLQSALLTTVAAHVCLSGTLVLYFVPCFQAKCNHSLILADLKHLSELTSVRRFVFCTYIDAFGEMNGRQGNAHEINEINLIASEAIMGILLILTRYMFGINSSAG